MLRDAIDTLSPPDIFHAADIIYAIHVAATRLFIRY